MNYWKQPLPKQPRSVLSAGDSIAEVLAHYRHGQIPDSITTAMLVTPVRRLLRGVYGSDLRAAGVLLLMAFGALYEALCGRAWRFWRYRVLRRDPEADLDAVISFRD